MSPAGVMSLVKFAPLMGKRLEELSVEDVRAVLDHFNIKVNVNDELLGAGIALMGGEDIHTVADMIQQPESIETLVRFITRNPREPEIVVSNITYDTPSYGVPQLIVANPGWRLP